MEKTNPEKEASMLQTSSVDDGGDTPAGTSGMAQRGPLSLDKRDWVSNLQRLARLEKMCRNYGGLLVYRSMWPR